MKEIPVYTGPNIAVTVGHGRVYKDVEFDTEAITSHLEKNGLTPEEIANTNIVLSDAVIENSMLQDGRECGQYLWWTDPNDGPASAIVVYTGPHIEAINKDQRAGRAVTKEEEAVAFDETSSAELARSQMHELTHHIVRSNPVLQAEVAQQDEKARYVRAATKIAKRADCLLTAAGVTAALSVMGYAGILDPHHLEAAAGVSSLILIASGLASIAVGSFIKSPYDQYRGLAEEKMCHEAQELPEAEGLVRVAYRRDYITGISPFEPTKLDATEQHAYILGLLHKELPLSAHKDSEPN
jgi:hypothetical protein